MPEHRRFQINPGPLRVVRRKHFATEHELAESVRCNAIKRDGSRCTRVQQAHSNYCWQHGRSHAQV